MYRYLENGKSLKLVEEACIGCGACVEVCPHAVFILAQAENGEGGRSASTARIIRRDGCMECGACELNCPVAAIQVRRGVGCAMAIWNGLRRGTEPDCGCSSTECC